MWDRSSICMNKFEQQIFEYLTRPGYKPVKSDKLIEKLKLSKKIIAKHREALRSLIEQGKVYENQQGRLKLKRAPDTIVGIIKRTASGSGFLIPHESPPGDKTNDVFISRSDIRDAHTGDEVVVRLLQRRRGGGRASAVPAPGTLRKQTTQHGNDGRARPLLQGGGVQAMNPPANNAILPPTTLLPTTLSST